MKRTFVILSNLLVSLFLVWVLTIWSDTYVSHFYPSVSAFDSSSDARFERVSAVLTKLAEDTDSLIAIQHQEADANGVPVFSYTTYGEGQLPEGLSEKSLEEASHSSLEANYFIFKGKATPEVLREELSKVGLTNLHTITPSLFTSLTALFGNGFQLITLLIFCLTFGALSLIGNIRSLKTAGIRLISGETRWKIFLRPLGHDVCNSLLGLTAGLLVSFILKTFISFPSIAFYTITVGLMVYNLLLLTLALFFAGLFAMGMKKVHLMQIIKGQIPVRGMISLMLLGQLLAVMIVSIGVSRTLVYSQAWQQQEAGESQWQQEEKIVSLEIARSGMTPGFSEEAIAKSKRWFQLVDKAVADQKAFLVRHYLAEQSLQAQAASSLVPESFYQDYGPKGNVLIVTPAYLMRQKIAVAPDIQEKMQHLATGEFVLLLPESLHSEETQYQTLFENHVTNLMASPNSRLEMTATVAYLETGYQRFIYNITPVSYQQFLKDPIIIVVTPQSTGEQSSLFWQENLQSYFFFENMTDSQRLIDENDVKGWVGELQTGYRLHQNLLKNIQREVWAMVAGAVLGILTSILMFHTMNRLYFEEFRRDIFIKRVAGQRFLEIHRKYLFAQVFVFLLGFLGSIFLAVNLLLALVVLLVFIGISLLQLQFQMKTENKMSMLIVKGG